ncbi:MAG: GTPase Era [Lachnospiraceae bacterium]|nr:GTPase Era [Lachnospiraceae bacterium]
MTRSGFVSLTGRPNVGKSTLMNQILGEKVAITSKKPQTTRKRIQGVYTDDQTQIVFIDTPGIHRAEHKLGEYMNEAATRTINDVDYVLFLVEAGMPRNPDLDIIKRFKKNHSAVILVINKVDTVGKDELIKSIDAFQSLYDFEEIVPVSAKTGQNVDELMKVIKARLPEGPFFFPEDMLTDQPERALCAEMIREKALKLMEREIPHGLAVTIETFGERDDKDIIDINATIICEKASHKPIIIGKGGAMLKKIGTYAREDMETLLGCKVNLQLWVKVKERWRDSDMLIKNYGFDKKELQ